MIYSTGTLSDQVQQSSIPCNFSSLPLELRRVIYYHLLIPSTVVELKWKAYDIETAILHVNKDFMKKPPGYFNRRTTGSYHASTPPFEQFWTAGI